MLFLVMPPHLRSDDRGVVTEPVELSGEVVHMLGHPAELRVVVFGDQRYSQRGGAHREARWACWASWATADTTAAGRSS